MEWEIYSDFLSEKRCVFCIRPWARSLRGESGPAIIQRRHWLKIPLLSDDSFSREDKLQQIKTPVTVRYTLTLRNTKMWKRISLQKLRQINASFPLPSLPPPHPPPPPPNYSFKKVMGRWNWEGLTQGQRGLQSQISGLFVLRLFVTGGHLKILVLLGLQLLPLNDLWKPLRKRL